MNAHELKQYVSQQMILKNIIIDDNQCWIWQRKLNEHGYGRITINKKTFKSHRISYMIFIGDIENDNVIDHLCRVRSCCNPEHLEQCSMIENTKRGFISRGYNRK